MPVYGIDGKRVDKVNRAVIQIEDILLETDLDWTISYDPNGQRFVIVINKEEK